MKIKVFEKKNLANSKIISCFIVNTNDIMVKNKILEINLKIF